MPNLVYQKLLSFLAFLFFLIFPLAFSYFPYLFGYQKVLGNFGVYEGTRLIMIWIFITVFFLVSFLPICISYGNRLLLQLLQKCRLRDFGKNFKLVAAVELFDRKTHITSLFHSIRGVGIGIFLISCLMSTFLQFFYRKDTIGNWYFGSTEFHLGYLWYTSIGIFAWIVFSVQKDIVRHAVSGAFLGLVGVILYAVIQYLGMDPINYSTPFESNRIFSTLGNPNMLAALLLLFIPVILFHLKDWRGWSCILLFLFLIITTQSWSAFFIACSLVFVYFVKNSGISKFLTTLFVLILAISLLETISNLQLHSKLLGLLTRWEMIQSSIQYLSQSFVWIFGGSEVQYHQYFNTNRTQSLLDYIPASHILGHSHNLFLDFSMRYGFLGVIGAFSAVFLGFKGTLLKKNLLSLFPQEVWYLIISFFLMAMIHHIELPVWVVFLLLVRHAYTFQYRKFDEIGLKF